MCCLKNFAYKTDLIRAHLGEIIKMVNKVNILESEKLKSWKPRLKYFIGAAILILLVIAVVLVVILNKGPDEPTSKSPNNTDDDLIFAHTVRITRITIEFFRFCNRMDSFNTFVRSNQ